MVGKTHKWESIYKIDYPDYEVIIVVNHSQDDSLKELKNPLKVKPYNNRKRRKLRICRRKQYRIRYALKYLNPKYILL